MKYIRRILSAVLIVALAALSTPVYADNIFVVPENISSIESQAFADIPADGVFLPESVTSAASDAFTRSDLSVIDIYGYSGGNAERIASEASARFVAVDIKNPLIAAPEWASPYTQIEIKATAQCGAPLTYAISIEKEEHEVFAPDANNTGEFAFTFTEGGIYDIYCVFTNEWDSTEASAQIEIAEPIKTVKSEFTIPVNVKTLIIDETETRDIQLVSSDPNGLSVDGRYATASALGAYTLTAQADLGDGKTVEREVSVNVVTLAESVNISQPTVNAISEGETLVLTAEVLPFGAALRDITWTSADESIATVDSTGLVTGVSKGETTIRAQLDDAYDEIQINVARYVTAFEMSRSSLPAELLTGMKTIVRANAIPADADDVSGVFASSDDSIASVNPLTGEVSLKRAGKVDISFTANDARGVSSSIELNIKQGAEAIAFANTSIEIRKGEMHTPVYQMLPEGAYGEPLSWRSSNEKVATVSKSGAITAHATGECVITAISQNGVTATVPVKVIIEETLADSPLNIVHMNVNSSVNANRFTFVYPENATYTSFTWQSSDPDVVEVNASTGVMTARKTGMARITGLTKHGYMVEFIATVITSKVITKIAVSESYHVAKLGDVFALTTKINTDAQTKEYMWYSDNTDVCEIATDPTQSGAQIRAVGIGAANIYAIASSGIAAVCQVVVNPIAVSSIRLNETSATLNKGDAIGLIAQRIPANASSYGISWSSSDESVATVDSDGIVRAVSGGTAIITVSTDDGIYTTCQIKVNSVPMVSAAVHNKDISGFAGEQYQITYSYLPENATPARFSWSSDDYNVALVDAKTGLVTFMGEGETVIRGYAVDGGDVMLEVNVASFEIPITEFETDAYSITLEKGESYSIRLSVKPDNASFATPVFSSNDESVAKVDENGVITAVKRGTAMIFATVGKGEYVKNISIGVTVTGESDVTYRALVVGQYSQSIEEHYLPFSTNGTKGVRDAMGRSIIDGNRYDVKWMGKNPTITEFAKALTDLSKVADENDVTVIYLLTHGGYSTTTGGVRKDYIMMTSTGASIKPSDMMLALKTISGHVVFVLCTCNSGGILDEDAVGALMSGGGSYIGRNGPGRLSILCSSSETRSSYYNVPNEDISRDFFTYAYTRGLGWDMIRDGELDKHYADTNGDGFITLGELSKYSRITTQREVSAFMQRQTGPFYGHERQFPSWWFASGEDDLVLFGY